MFFSLVQSFSVESRKKYVSLYEPCYDLFFSKGLILPTLFFICIVYIPDLHLSEHSWLIIYEFSDFQGKLLFQKINSYFSN